MKCQLKPIIPKLCFMLLWTDYSGNYAGILDASVPETESELEQSECM